MRGLLTTSLAAAALAACSGGSGGNGSADAAGDGNLPQRGMYEITRVHEVTGSTQPMKQQTSQQCFSQSDMEKFAALFAGKPPRSNCHDVQADAGDGSFSIRMSCDAPDGDLLNIPTEVRGTWSRDEFEIVEEVTLMGMTQRETRTYRRKGDC